jgi:hypothetical protein
MNKSTQMANNCPSVANVFLLQRFAHVISRLAPAATLDFLIIYLVYERRVRLGSTEDSYRTRTASFLYALYLFY